MASKIVNLLVLGVDIYLLYRTIDNLYQLYEGWSPLPPVVVNWNDPFNHTHPVIHYPPADNPCVLDQAEKPVIPREDVCHDPTTGQFQQNRVFQTRSTRYPNYNNYFQSICQEVESPQPFMPGGGGSQPGTEIIGWRMVVPTSNDINMWNAKQECGKGVYDKDPTCGGNVVVVGQ